MTREALANSTTVAIDDAISAIREEIMAGRGSNAVEYASVVRDLAAALVDLEDD